MGSRGPVPKRSDEKLGHAHQAGGHDAGITKGTARGFQRRPSAPKSWHPVAKKLWEAAADSGGADFYERSDLMVLYFACDQITSYYNSPRPSAQHLMAIISLLDKCLLTEADRRRAGIELVPPSTDESEADLHIIQGFKEDLGAN